MFNMETNLTSSSYLNADCQPNHIVRNLVMYVECCYVRRVPKGFHLKSELVSYCKNDVTILRSASTCFRQLLLEKTRLDPFVVAMTVAGMTLKVYRASHLWLSTMIHTPEYGLRRGERASVEALRYMRLYEMLNPGVQVQTAEWAMGEACVEDSGLRLDGLVQRQPPLRPLAIEYLGFVLLINFL